VIACPACGAENPDHAKFCMECAAPLAAPSPVCEERKVVTTLFCDLVSFTAMSESADPEDVDRILNDYFARATKAIESHGGTVEKFIGDAVVGVFGVPAVHEDDPERAVRAGLRILEALEGMTRPDGSPLQARVGINTGEALVRLDVDPASGLGFLTGDAVNTAARLEATAPPGGIVVGKLTHDLTERVIVYGELPPIAAKGKVEPVSAWLAKKPVARRGIDATDLTALVGREVELKYLETIFEQAVSQSVAQFALIVGEPGIGKSRLVRELLRVVDGRPETTVWRQGYCRPFGEGVEYGPLSDIVKGHAGILDSDAAEHAAARLDAVVPEGPDRDWLLQRMRAVVGLSAPEAAREENFAAWLRFFEGVSAREPVVLVFEDLHWADDALLAFIEYLAMRIDSVPLLLIGTTRPELFEHRPGFAAGAQVTRIDLVPLSPAETAQLAADLLGMPGDRTHTVGELVERCEGNPFYVEQSVRLLADAGRTSKLPDSVQAVIAARLDALGPAQKALLCDAAVVGGVFWEGAVRATQDREVADVEALLAGLIERRLIRRIRESSMRGEREFAFAHALARDVAYGQLPRAARAHRHTEVADWLIAGAGSCGGDVAATIAHHAVMAVELARQAHEDVLAARMLPVATEWLSTAGDRALRLDLGVARRYYERALELLGDGALAPPGLLQGLAEALELTGSVRDAASFYRQAAAQLEGRGDIRATAVVLMRLGSCLTSLGESDAREVEGQAQRLLDDDGPSPEHALVLAQCASRQLAIVGDASAALALAERSFAMAAELGIPVPLQAYEYRGGALCGLGDAAGLDDMRRASELAETEGNASSIYYSLANESVSVSAFRGPAAITTLVEHGLERATRRGAQAAQFLFEAMLLEAQFLLGEWDEVLTRGETSARKLAETGEVTNSLAAHLQLALVRAYRGQAKLAEQLVRDMLEVGAESSYLWYPVQAAAAVRDRLGDRSAALDHLRTLVCLPTMGTDCSEIAFLAEAVRLTTAAEELELAASLQARIGRATPVEQHAQATADALVHEARGELKAAAAGFSDAARRWHDFGVPYEEAQALLGHGRCLVVLGTAAEAGTPLVAARELFARLGARPALEETEGWLVKVSGS
jgi:class 3 adenylate cyclase/tetratricopeptide (TPR) repeat protein